MKHDFQTLAEVFSYATSKYAKRPAYGIVGEKGGRYNYAEFKDCCRRISRLLSNFGINPNDKVAIFSQNMPNWAIAFFSVTAFGRIAVPMLTELSENEIRNILTHSETKAMFVSRRLFPKIPKDLLDKMHIVIATDDLSILQAEDSAYTCDGRIKAPQPDDLACLIYTSGTTGSAKGVMLTHRNFCANILAAWKAQPVFRHDVFLSILPLAHTYEMSIGMLYAFATGAMTWYMNRPPTASVLLPALKSLRPTVMLSVPLVIEKIYRNSIVPTIEKSRFLRSLKKSFPRLLYWLVGMKLKGTFGGRIKFFGIGGAKLDAEVEDFLGKAAFPYAIGYGMTEVAPLICNASPYKTHLGTTGIHAHGVQIRLENINPATGEGEIVVKGDAVMMGYYKDYRRTREVLSDDGWFHTGDLATLDKKGRYSIKGRLGSVIIGPSGENIYPEEIESVINNFRDVNESLVVEKDGHLIALVHFNDDVLDWNYDNQDKFLEDLEKRKAEILDFVNSKVNRNSRIKEVQIEQEPFIKTATLKIRRFLYKDGKSPDKK
ncbi:MAG: AMP-binding protein [Bacteroidales bacterium]|nr:AMP-binding protein [Bacteroidales bacterium]